MNITVIVRKYLRGIGVQKDDRKFIYLENCDLLPIKTLKEVEIKVSNKNMQKDYEGSTSLVQKNIQTEFVGRKIYVDLHTTICEADTVAC